VSWASGLKRDSAMRTAVGAEGGRTPAGCVSQSVEQVKRMSLQPNTWNRRNRTDGRCRYALRACYA
jgi:hypothetical protein